MEPATLEATLEWAEKVYEKRNKSLENLISLYPGKYKKIVDVITDEMAYLSRVIIELRHSLYPGTEIPTDTTDDGNR